MGSDSQTDLFTFGSFHDHNECPDTRRCPSFTNGSAHGDDVRDSCDSWSRSERNAALRTDRIVPAKMADEVQKAQCAEKTEDTIFGKILRKEIPCTFIHEDDQVRIIHPTNIQCTSTMSIIFLSSALRSMT